MLGLSLNLQHADGIVRHVRNDVHDDQSAQEENARQGIEVGRIVIVDGRGTRDRLANGDRFRVLILLTNIAIDARHAALWPVDAFML